MVGCDKGSQILSKHFPEKISNSVGGQKISV